MLFRSRPHFNIGATIPSPQDTADYVGVDHRGGRLQAQLIGLPADYDLALTDLAGTVLHSSASTGKRSETIRVTLPAGRYLLAVLPKAGQHSPAQYRLNVTG